MKKLIELKSLNIVFYENKFYTISGSNNSGKTTLIRILNASDNLFKAVIPFELRINRDNLLEELNYQNNDLVFLENVGNLICPAEFDTGAGRNVMILSVPEGDDKPLKYPLMFTKSDVLIITKIDTISVFDFDFDKCEQRAKKLNPNIQIFKVSAKTGEGMEEWEKWLSAQVKQWV